MTEGVLLSVGLISILLLALLILVFAGITLFNKGKSHTVKKKIEKHVPSFNVEPQETKETKQSIFKRQDIVFGNLIVDGVEYTTYDEGEVTIYSKTGVPVLAFKIDGYNNQQREINYVRIGHDLRQEYAMYYIMHNPAHAHQFNQWLQFELAGNQYQEVAMQFQDLARDLAGFNNLLAQKCIRKFGRDYVWTA